MSITGWKTNWIGWNWKSPPAAQPGSTPELQLIDIYEFIPPDVAT
jgi:hypothetical protein